MSKKWILLLGLVCCTVLAGLVFAEGRAESYGIEWDADAVAGMSKAERQAYQKVYKAKLEAVARQRGWTPGDKRSAKRVIEGSGRQAAAPNKAFGSITYHSGLLGPCGGCGTSESVGNRYDSALNPAMTAISPVMMSGAVTRVTFDMIAVGGGAVFLSFFDGLAGTAAALVTSISVPATAGVNTFVPTASIGYAGSTFLAGVWNFTAGSDTPAVATGSVSGQGFHGMSINDIAGTGFATIGSLNGAITIGGDVLTPVELLNFEVE